MEIELTIARNSIIELTSIEIQLYLHELRNQLHEQYPDADIDINLGLQSICHNSQDDDSINQHVERIVQQTFDDNSWWLSSYHEGLRVRTFRFEGSTYYVVDGEQYRLDVVDDENNRYVAYVRFPALKGREDEYPWDDIDQYVVAVTEA